MVEDNAADVFLIREALRTRGISAELQVVKDGEQATRFFDEADKDETSPCPELMILDINLPRMNGGQVLEHMRQSRRCGQACVIVVSTSDSPQDREEMHRLGANGYFRKPSDYDEFLKLGDLVRDLFGGAAEPEQ